MEKYVSSQDTSFPKTLLDARMREMVILFSYDGVKDCNMYTFALSEVYSGGRLRQVVLNIYNHHT